MSKNNQQLTEESTVSVKPHSYQPSKAELEEQIYIPAPNPETLAKALMSGGATRK